MDFEDTHRWSELIPPQTALTFAAMYDPNEGIITFSGGSLLESSDSGYTSASSPSKYSQDSDSPRDAYDSQSQVLTIDRLAYALDAVAPNSAALAVENESGLPFTFVCGALESQSMLMNIYGPTDNCHQCSSSSVHLPKPNHRLFVVNGPISPESDYLRGSGTVVASCADQADQEQQQQPQIEWSHLRQIGSKLLSAAKTPFDGRMFLKRCRSSESSRSSDEEGQTGEYSERFFEDACLTGNSFYTAPLLVNLNLKSTFSVTTASTSPFVHVSVPSVGSADSPQFPGAFPSPHNESNTLHIPHPNTDHARSETWRTPTLDAFEFLEGECPNSPREFRRRLKKMRRHRHPPPPPVCTSPCSHNHHHHQQHLDDLNEPASPEEVLARHEYNHVSAPSPSRCSGGSFSKTPRPPGLRRQKSFTAKMRKSVVEKLTKFGGAGAGDEQWVWVEVTHKVTQHVLSVSSSM
ncbi:hypothetical protein BXZ70DRAFT_494489 [Cristinia sonorae]|uniref:Uncharacterized protein n=1 Tax=Cristinia sonorae TaxID=1940300 RepID=A0A8K0XLH2_9AGAR|nr:hypothetical protein BXZ70DRAFT_494489 [Cristinia sonorae]